MKVLIRRGINCKNKKIFPCAVTYGAPEMLYKRKNIFFSKVVIKNEKKIQKSMRKKR